MHIRNDQRGALDPLMIPLIVSVILVLGLAGFGIWAYTQYLSERDNVDSAISTAVARADEQIREELESELAEREESPYRKWRSGASLGSIQVTYPKTWSAYVDERDSGSTPLDAYFHPSFVPADKNTRYAARVLIDEKQYSRVIESYNTQVEKGQITAKPITIAGITGTRFDGQIERDYKGSLVIFQLRDKTVRVWTESESYSRQFDSIILKFLEFDK